MDAKNNSSRCIDLICDPGYYRTDIGHCVSICGDGVVIELLEQCDDNNTDDGDGCSH